jgi:hypothetical protein
LATCCDNGNGIFLSQLHNLCLSIKFYPDDLYFSRNSKIKIK